MQHTETRTTYTPGATAVEERKGFNPLWLLLPLLAGLARWLGWRAMDNDDEPADTTTISATATGTEITVNGQVEVPVFGQVEVPTLCGLIMGSGVDLLGVGGLGACGRTGRW